MNRVISAIVFIVLLTSMLVLASFVHPANAEFGTIYIRADGSIDPPTAPISTVDNVTYILTGNITSDADGIVVEKDNIVVDGLGFSVEGAKADNGIYLNGRYNVTLQNMNIKSFYQGITLSYSTNCSIVENNVTGNGHYGIWLDSSSNNSIGGNTIANNSDGIYLSSSCDYDSIVENNVADNFWYAIGLFDTSNYNNIIGNTITNSYCGLGLTDSHNNNISGNAFTRTGLSLQYSYSNSLENNTVNGKPLVYLEGATDQSVGDAGQVVLVRCDRIRVENLSLSQTSTAIILWETHNSIISGNNITATSSSGISLAFSSTNNSINGNNITNNGYNGITLSYSSTYNSINGNNILDNGYCGIELMRSSNYNSISRNDITGNDNYGIRFEFYTNYNSISGNNIMNDFFGILFQDSSGNNTIIKNNIASNIRGIYLTGSFYNILYHNNLFDSNTYLISGPNFWDNGYPSGGNYWGSYSGTDDYSGPYQNETGSDGIGDSPVSFDANNVDNYPLMKAYVQFENQTIYIKADGTIDPPTAPIRRNGDIYMLTDNIGSPADGIVVERDNIVFDGSGFTVEGAGAEYSDGILLWQRDNVTIQNINIKSFSDGILLHASVNNRIIGNNVSDNNQGILLAYSSNGNSLIGNTITANWGDGIMLHSALNNGIGENTIANNNYNGIKLEQSSNYTSIFGNNIANNSQYGIWFDASSDNSISGNTIVNNLYGVMIDYNSEPWYCVNNTFCHNNFISNTRHVINWTPTDAHHWDNGCEGNFWDNYNGTDLDNDGVGDTFLPWNWVDNYPLMNLYWNPCDIDHNLKVDMKDIGKSAKAFGTQSGDTLWNPHADITGLEPLVPDGKVDMRDISLIARHFMEHYP